MNERDPLSEQWWEGMDADDAAAFVEKLASSEAGAPPCMTWPGTTR